MLAGTAKGSWSAKPTMLMAIKSEIEARVKAQYRSSSLVL